MSNIRQWIIPVVLLIAAITPVRAEEAASAASPSPAASAPSAGPSAPFVGKVTGSTVNVRAGANPNFEVIHRVTRGEPVIVLDQHGDWYAIELPPEGSCFMAAQFVARNAGSSGRVTGANVNLRGGPGTKFNALGKLSAGQLVTILGEQDGWLRIVPPSTVRGWIATAYVQPDPSGQLDIVQTVYQTRAAALTATPATAGAAPAASAASLPAAMQGRLEPARGFLWRRPAGTHQLIRHHQTVAWLASETIPLNQYLHQDIAVWGQVEDASSTIPHITVTRVSVDTAPSPLPVTSGESTAQPSASSGRPAPH